MKKIDTKSMVVLADQKPGTVVFKNYDELKARIEKGVAYYESVQYTTENIDDAIANRDELKTVKKALEDSKKAVEAAYKAPYIDFEEKLDELINMVKIPFKIADDFIKASEKAVKEEEIRAYAKKKAAVLGEYADKIVSSEKFFNEKWLNASYKIKQWQSDIDDIIARASDDILTIQATAGENTSAAMANYYQTLSIDSVKTFISELKSGSMASGIQAVKDDGVIGYKVLRIFASERKMLQIMTQLEMLEVEFEELEDGMPKAMTELRVPDFDSFVAFDIEHTGTLGVAHGDAESEIIEIGAVKVVNGVIVDRFNEICDPGRKITPRVARLTGITDEMVADKPAVTEVIKKFKDFVGDAILLGHNIKSCDIPHITRAAKNAGFAFENRFFDTKPFASSLKEKMGVTDIKLTTLSERFGITQTDAHRAWCDAEVNAKVFFELKGF